MFTGTWSFFVGHMLSNIGSLLYLGLGYKDALQKFRLPFMDYLHSDFIGLPEIFTKRELIVNVVEGGGLVPVSIPNPFLQYVFPRDVFANDSVPLQKFERNAANMPSTRAGSPTLRPKALPPNFREYARKYFMKMFDTSELEETFERNLSYIHDAFHGAMGGHMTIVDFAAFDPIFMIHHCSIDRYFQIWYYLKQVNYDEEEAMEPFLKNQEDMWKATEFRQLGNTYLELSDSLSTEEVELLLRFMYDITVSTLENDE